VSNKAAQQRCATKVCKCIVLPIEQMEYIGTLLPFGETAVDFSNCTITNVTFSWRLFEVRFVDMQSNAQLVYSYNQDSNTEWIRLLASKYCKLQGVVHHFQQNLLYPVGIRILLNKQAIADSLQDSNWCSNEFMEFESCLAKVFDLTDFVLEPAKTKKRDALHKPTEIHPDIRISDQVYWNYDKGQFLRAKRTSTCQHPFLSFTPANVFVVSTCTNHWYADVLEHCFLDVKRHSKKPEGSNNNFAISNNDFSLLQTMSACLIVTDGLFLDAWQTMCFNMGLPYVIVQPSGVSKKELFHSAIALCTFETLEKNICSIVDMEASVSLALQMQRASIIGVQNTALSVPFTYQQVRRYIQQILLPKYDSFDVPLSLIEFGSVLFDSMELRTNQVLFHHFADSLQCKKLVHIYRQYTTRPSRFCTFLSDTFVGQKWAKGHKYFLQEPFSTIIETPKHVLKRFKLIGHPIKNSAVEDRIEKLFKSKYCPIPISFALQRFSNKSVPVHVAKSLVENHCSRMLVTLGTFLQPVEAGDTFAIHPTFLSEIFTKSAHECCICYDGMSSAKFCMTLCGHTYCTDCAKRQFYDTWNQNKVKECAACRTPLLSGDFFSIRNDKEYELVVHSKEKAVQILKESLKKDKAQFAYYSDLLKQSNDLIRGQIKYVLFESIASNEALLQLFSQVSQTIQLHLFYTQEEQDEFYKFSQCF